MQHNSTNHEAGERFGRLVILRRDFSYAPNKAEHARWICQCDCGVSVSVRGTGLRSGETKSCGCLARELSSQRGRTILTKHGKANTPEHRCWKGMRDRCLSPRHRLYPRWGGRGITICPEWDDFMVFYRDMGPRPSPNHSLDRIDNDGPYAPGNCRWATRSEQQRNTRRNTLLTYQGRTMPIRAWADETGIHPNTLSSRIKKGWPPDRVLCAP
jgi:hypothetical protein